MSAIDSYSLKLAAAVGTGHAAVTCVEVDFDHICTCFCFVLGSYVKKLTSGSSQEL